MKTLDNLLLCKLLLHIPADYRWTDAGIVRIGAERGIATSSISSARSMFRCLSTSFKGNDGKADMNCLAVASLRLGGWRMAKVLETSVRERRGVESAY